MLTVTVRRPALRYLASMLVVSLCGVGCTDSESARLEVHEEPQLGIARPAVGIAPFVSDRLDQIIRRQHPNVRALLIGRHGRGLVERYYGGSSWDDHTNIYGITNTVLSMLIGIALEERAIGGLDHSLAQLLPRQLARRAPPAVRRITLRQLLTMTSGMVPDPPGSQAATAEFVADLGWVPGILTHHPIVPPGTLLIYSSAATHLLSVILAEATGTTTLQYAREKLFRPLGIATDPALEPPASSVETSGYDRAGFAWPRDPRGYHLGFGYLRLTPLDMLKLGQLYLDNGRWLGRQIVPAEYVRQSTQAYATSATTASFGYQWWFTAAQRHNGFAARGFGGQLLYVVPDLGLVVAISCRAPAMGPIETATRMEALINRVVLPALDAPSDR